MKSTLRILFTALILTGTVNSANNGGTESPFSFGTGARELSMGTADIATCGFETAPFWNPSRLANAQQYQISGFHSKLFDSEVSYQYLGLVAPTLDFGTFAVGIFRLGIDGIEVRDINNFLSGHTSDDRLAVYFSYGRSLRNFDIGASVTIEHHSLADYSSTSSPGVNLSASKRLELNSQVFKSLSISVNAVNVVRPTIELDAASYSYPFSGMLSMSVGMNPLKMPEHSVTLAASLKKTNKIDPKVTVGIEYALNDMLFLRSGINDSKFAAGIGIKYSAMSFDYAIVDRDLDLLHTFTLTTAIGKPVSQRLEERLAKREAEFNRMMGERLTQRNRGLVDDMLKEGKSYFEQGRLTDAVGTFERALFMAKANKFDTTKISELLVDSRTKLDEIMALKLYRENLDSANAAFDRKDYISARYFASTALEQRPNSDDAKSLIDRASKAIEKITARNEFIEERLAKSDSLLSSGRINQAINLLNGLIQTYKDDPRINQLHKKAHFERLREIATNSYTQRKYGAALTALDSALVLFPNHEWCLSLKSSILLTQSTQTAKNTETVIKTRARPSEQVLKEAESEYNIAQSMFTGGNLTGAITHWENVERLVPDYQSVRDYLLKAYKFLGVEYYSKGELREAILVWEKALKLVPNNEEIKTYIQRTETELKKLEQLSYESK